VPVNLGEGYVPIYLTGMSGFRAGLSAAHRQLTASIHRMDAVARKARFGLMLAAGATAGAMRIAGGFEQGMARVKALSGATGGTFDALRDQALLLGQTTVFTSRQAADAMSFFALAGFDAQKIMQAMPATLDLAAAGQIDVAESADIAAKIMAGMGIEATELTYVMDVLTKAFTTSNTDLRMLGDAFKYVGPIGKASGKSIEELTASIMAMSNAGIQGQMAGVALRSILIRLQAQPGEVQKALAMLGVEIEDESGKMKHLADIVDEVRAAMEGHTSMQQQQIVAMLAGTRAAAAFAVMMEEGGDAIRGMESRLEGAAGTTKRMATEMIDTLFGALKLLWSAVERLAIAFGSRLTPQIRSLTESLTELTKDLADNKGGMLDNAMVAAEMATKWGLLLAVLPSVMSAMASLMMITAIGGPLGLGLTALSAALVVIVGSFAEAEATGGDFFEVLSRNIGVLTGITKETERAERALARFNDELQNLPSLGPEEFEGTREQMTEEIERLREAARKEREWGTRGGAYEEAARAVAPGGKPLTEWEALGVLFGPQIDIGGVLYDRIRYAITGKTGEILAQEFDTAADVLENRLNLMAEEAEIVKRVEAMGRRLFPKHIVGRISPAELAEARIRKHMRAEEGPDSYRRMLQAAGVTTGERPMFDELGQPIMVEHAVVETDKAEASKARMEFSGVMDFWKRMQQQIADDKIAKDQLAVLNDIKVGQDEQTAAIKLLDGGLD